MDVVNNRCTGHCCERFYLSYVDSVFREKRKTWVDEDGVEIGIAFLQERLKDHRSENDALEALAKKFSDMVSRGEFRKEWGRVCDMIAMSLDGEIEYTIIYFSAMHAGSATLGDGV